MARNLTRIHMRLVGEDNIKFRQVRREHYARQKRARRRVSRLDFLALLMSALMPPGRKAYLPWGQSRGKGGRRRVH